MTILTTSTRKLLMRHKVYDQGTGIHFSKCFFWIWVWIENSMVYPGHLEVRHVQKIATNSLSQPANLRPQVEACRLLRAQARAVASEIRKSQEKWFCLNAGTPCIWLQGDSGRLETESLEDGLHRGCLQVSLESKTKHIQTIEWSYPSLPFAKVEWFCVNNTYIQ